jgi:hypothetical protein
MQVIEARELLEHEHTLAQKQAAGFGLQAGRRGPLEFGPAIHMRLRSLAACTKFISHATSAAMRPECPVAICSSCQTFTTNQQRRIRYNPSWHPLCTTGAALARLSILKQRLGAEQAGNDNIHEHVATVEEQCRGQAAELSEQSSKRMLVERLAATAERACVDELKRVTTELTERDEQLRAVRQELAVTRQQKEYLSSQLRVKDKLMKAAFGHWAAQAAKTRALLQEEEGG